MGANSSKHRKKKRIEKKINEDDTRSQTPDSIDIGIGDTAKTPSSTESDVKPPSPNETFEITSEQLQALVKDAGECATSRIDKLGGVERLCEVLKTSPTRGLSGSEKDIEARQKHFGENVTPLKDTKCYLPLVRDALRDIPVIVLLTCASVCLVTSKLFTKKRREVAGVWGRGTDGDGQMEGFAVLIGALISVLISLLDEHSRRRRHVRIQRKQDQENVVNVLRMGVIQSIKTRNIVVGDICVLKTGNLISADGVIIQSNGLKVYDMQSEELRQFDCKSEKTDPILHAGSNVMEGSAKMLVMAVGSNRKTSSASKKCCKKTPAHSELKERVLYTTACIVYTGYMVALLIVIILLTQYILLHFLIRGEPISWSTFEDVLRILVVGISVIVVSLSPAIPLTFHVSARSSMKILMRENTLVKKQKVCEVIGNVTTICCDKTGTLTVNKSAVAQSYICEMRRRIVPSYNEIHPNVAFKLVQNICVNSEYSSRIATPGKSRENVGNKLECALLEFVDRLGISFQELRSREPEDDFVHVYGFSSERKSMSTVLRQKNGFRLLTKGAAERVLEKCRWIYGSRGTLVTASRNERRRISNHVIAPMTSEGLRCVTLAYRDFVINGPVAVNETLVAREPNWEAEGLIVNYMTCLGIVGIQDPLRPETPLAVELCDECGVVVRMVTGDNVETARAVALRCGILRDGEDGLVMDGGEFNARIRDGTGKMRQDLFDSIWPRLRVLARASPIDKYNLVRGITRSKVFGRSELVAAVGDGVDDVPALKEAHVGFVMGTSDSRGAKVAADVLMLDDNFCNVVRAVLLGRNVRATVCRCLQFQLVLNISTIGLAVIGVCTLQTTPLRPLQMLWTNTLVGLTAALVFPTEFTPLSLVSRKCYSVTESLISPHMVRHVFGHSLYTLTVCVMLVFLGETILGVKSGRESRDPTEHFTVVFNSFAYMMLGNVVVSRKGNAERSVFQGMLGNPMFCFLWLTSALAQAVVVEFGRTPFCTCPLRWDLWLWCLGLGASVTIFHQVLLLIPVDICTKLVCWETAAFLQKGVVQHSLAAKWRRLIPGSVYTGSYACKDSHAPSGYTMS